MIVLDASAAVELLLHTSPGQRIARRLSQAGTIHCPHLIDIEIAQTLRRLARQGEISQDRAAAALTHWQSLDIQRYVHLPFLPRVWALKDNLSAYDAVYIALAEALQSGVLTGDRRLAAAPGTSVVIEVMA